MGILIITWNFPPRRGGMESLVGELYRALRARHTVSVITSYAPSAREEEEEIYRSPWPGLVVFAVYAVWRGAALLRHNPGLKVVLGGSAMVTPLVLCLAGVFRRKAVVQTHGLDLVYRSSWYQNLCVRWLKYSTAVVANSCYTASLAIAKGAPRNSLAVIAPGVHWERFASCAPDALLRRELGLEDKRIILFVGRLARRKGVMEFIQNAMVKVVQEIPRARLVIVGDNPTESLTHKDDIVSEIKVAISELHLDSHVRWLGSLSDESLARVYQLCDVLILPALEMGEDLEGFGIVLLEAAAAGKPAIATRTGGIPDAIEDGKSGILVEPGNYEQLSRSLIGLLTDEEKRRAMGEYAKRRAKEQFSWDKTLVSYEAVLSDALGRKN